MNLCPQFCGMKNQTQKNTNTVSGIFVLLLGFLITSGLYLLKHFNILHLGFDLILAPLVVFTLLAFGDKILIYFLVIPIGFVSKLIDKVQGFSQSKS